MNLSSCYLFDCLSDRQIEQLSGVAVSMPFRAGEWLFHKAEAAECLYLVESGAVELLIEVQQGIEIPISLVRPNNGCVGVSALIEPYRYSLSARCIQEGTLCAMRREHILPLFDQNPSLGRIIMTNLARKLLERLTETRQEVQMRYMSLVRSTTF